MTTRRMLIALMLFTLAGAGLACAEDDDGIVKAGSDADSDGDADSDAGTDADTDGDADSDGDVDSDGDSDSDADADADGDADGDTDADTDADADADTDADADGDTDTGEEQCGEMDFPIEAKPSRLMLLIDSSGSMNDGIDVDFEGNPTGPAKWPIAQAALVEMIQKYSNVLHFGFDVFPNGTSLPGCAVGQPVKQDVQFDDGSQVISFIQGRDTNGAGTPLYCGMANFLDTAYAPVFSSPEASSYLIVISDGGDTCGEGCCMVNITKPKTFQTCTATANEFATLTTDLLSQDILTYAIGFGGGVSEDELNAIAAAGGTGETTYFDAADQQALIDALSTIGDSAVSCTYAMTLPQEDSDPGKVNIYFDGDIIGYDEDCAVDKGWAWTDATHTAIRFCDDACNRLRTGTVAKVSATFGCKSVIVV